MTPTHSTLPASHVQELLDASAQPLQAAHKGSAQYFTPDWFAEQQAGLLPCFPHAVLDPQAGAGALLRASGGYGTKRFGIEIDPRVAEHAHGAELIVTANCVTAFELLDEFFPDLVFPVQVANPPFGISWKTAEGPEDSIKWTWRRLLKHAGHSGCGFMIASLATLKRISPANDPTRLSRHAYLYQTFPSGIFPDADVEIGVLHFHKAWTGGPHVHHHASAGKEEVRRQFHRLDGYRPSDLGLGGSSWEAIHEALQSVQAIIREERRKLPPFNIWLDQHGYLRTYLSTRRRLARKLTRDEATRLYEVGGCHPLTLTTERETRELMRELVECGHYTIEPAALKAIESALEECEKIAIPVMPITDFQRVAYCDEEDSLLAIKDSATPALTRGRTYKLATSTYNFIHSYESKRLHSNEGGAYVLAHHLLLSGQDRYVEIIDDEGEIHRFMDRPSVKAKGHREHSDVRLWELFQKPEVRTVAEVYPEQYRANLAVMNACELLGGFSYYPGQRDFIARAAIKDYALVGAETGVGKTLIAITLIALKAPMRALIVAPQGTTRAPEDDDSDEPELQASQWITELRRFAPEMQVFELFSEEDYQRICALNGGTLPRGVYVSYYEAMFSNGAREWSGERYDDARFIRDFQLPLDSDARRGQRILVDKLGEEHNGIRCIARPCLATQIGHLFDFVAYDEAHRMSNLQANITQMMIRLQPRYRYALTATPIPNIVSNLFSLMGWLCVPGWFRGDIRNAAWPYARHELGRFNRTFLTEERDLTAEAIKKEADPKWKGQCKKTSPIISSPARLLKLITPTMAFISKKACRPDLPPRRVHDIRVPMGVQQARLYAYYMDRQHIPARSALEAAAKQVQILRSVCADPAGTDWNNVPGKVVTSNFNPKTAAVLSLIEKCLREGRQVVVVSARVGQTAYFARHLAEAGVPFARIDSSLPPEQHTAQANLFKAGRARVMLMGIKCAQAHSFPQCQALIVASLEYSPGPFEQAIGRIYRVNTPNAVDIWCVLTANSIEEVMFDIVATKGDAATICLRGERLPRDFQPGDPGEVMAIAFERAQKSGLGGAVDETACELGWRSLREALHLAVKSACAA